MTHPKPTVREAAQALIALAEKATPKPWAAPPWPGQHKNRVIGGESANICGMHDGGQTRESIDANAEFIAEARNTAPDIAAAFLRAVELLRECRNVLDQFGGIRAIDLTAECAEFLKEIE